MQERDLPGLIERASAGGRADWDEVVTRFESLVWACTFGFELTQAARESVFQLTWLRLLDSIGGVNPPHSLTSWLIETARRECLQMDAHPSFAAVSNEVKEEIPRPKPGSAAPMSQRFDEVGQILSGLDGSCQFLLRLLASDAPVEPTAMADALGIDVASLGAAEKGCLEQMMAQPNVAHLLEDDARLDLDQTGQSRLVGLISESIQRNDPIPEASRAASRESFSWFSADASIAVRQTASSAISGEALAPVRSTEIDLFEWHTPSVRITGAWQPDGSLVGSVEPYDDSTTISLEIQSGAASIDVEDEGRFVVKAFRRAIVRVLVLHSYGVTSTEWFVVDT